IAVAPLHRRAALSVAALTRSILLSLHPRSDLHGVVAVEPNLHVVSKIEPGDGEVGGRRSPYSLQPFKTHERTFVDVVVDVRWVFLEHVVEDRKILRDNRFCEFLGLGANLLLRVLTESY